MPRRSAQKRKAVKRTNRISKHLSLVFLFILSVLFLGGFAFYKVLTKNFAAAFSTSSYDLSQEDFVTVLFIQTRESLEDTPLFLNKASLFIFDKKNKKVIEYGLPVNAVVDVPGRFGEEELSKVPALGALSFNSEPEHGAELTRLTVKKIFGLHVDRVAMVDSRMWDELYSFLVAGRLSPMLNISNLTAVRTSLKTDLRMNELYSLHTYASTVTKGSRQTHDLTLLNDVGQIDKKIQDITFASKIAYEKKSVAVLNGTVVSGAADFGSRVVANAGGRAISIGNAANQYSESVLVVDEMYSETVSYLLRFFDVKHVLLRSDASYINEDVINRADITLIVGLDIAEKL